MKRLPAQPLVGRPTVSVVIPCYNYGRFLPDAVASALDQSGVDVDVLIVDDASADDSVAIADRLAANDSRVSLLVHDVNRGHIQTYRDGLNRARGDYVVLLSADDLVTPDSFTRAAALMQAHPEVALTYGYTVDFIDIPPIPELAVRSWSIWSGPQWISRLCRRGNNVVVNPEAMLRTSVMHDIGGYDSTLPHAADMLLWMQAALRGAVGRVNGPDQACYRSHGSNMHLTDYSGLMTDLQQRRLVFERIVSDREASQLQRSRLHAQARRALARESVRLGCQAYDTGGSHGGADIMEFAQFAVETWPGIAGTPAWRGLERRLVGPIPHWRIQVSGGSRVLRESLRWRRWRRYGT